MNPAKTTNVILVKDGINYLIKKRLELTEPQPKRIKLITPNYLQKKTITIDPMYVKKELIDEQECEQRLNEAPIHSIMIDGIKTEDPLDLIDTSPSLSEFTEIIQNEPVQNRTTTSKFGKHFFIIYYVLWNSF